MSISYTNSNEINPHNLISYASQEQLVTGPTPHNPMSSSVSVDNISLGYGAAQFQQYGGTQNIIFRQNNEYSRPLENTGRSVSSESAFQARRSPGSSCSDYSVFSNPSLQSIPSYDSNHMFSLPMGNISTQNTPGYTSAINNPSMMDADSCGNGSPHKSSSMPGLDRVPSMSFTPGLPLSSIAKRYEISEEENDVGPPIGVLQGSPGHANSPSDVYHDSTPLPHRRYPHGISKDPNNPYNMNTGYLGVHSNGQLLDNRMTSLSIEDRNMFGSLRKGGAITVLAEVEEDPQQPSCSNPEGQSSLKSGERPQKKRKHGSLFTTSKSTPNLAKRGEKGEHKKGSAQQGMCQPGSNGKKKTFFEKSKLDCQGLEPHPIEAINDMYTHTPAYMNLESASIGTMGMGMYNNFGSNVPISGMTQNSNQLVSSISPVLLEQTLSPLPFSSCSEIGNGGAGNDSTLKGFNRTPSHPATIATANLSSYDPGYLGFPLSGISELKPDPDDLDQSIPQMEIGPILSDISTSGAATLTREPNYDYQALKWAVFAPESFSSLYAENETDPVQITDFKVVADKGFHFSFPDEAFICQKKNHFQVSITLCFDKKPRYIQAADGQALEKIAKFTLHLYGMRLESMNTQVTLDKSQPDRSKIPFDPVDIIDPPVQKPKKTTIGKLHFSETTANNMRKKGKPNPDQRFFCLLVALRAITENRTQHIAIIHKSDKIIVRASNPSQFENDIDYMWTRCNSPEAIYHSGRVGINTDHPDEALVVYGNLKLTGQLLKPSDRRYKEGLLPVSSEQQLETISKLRIYDYSYTKEYTDRHGVCEGASERGFIAQEVKRVMPQAIHEMRGEGGSDPYLAVNKDCLYVEAVGAVQELDRKTKHLKKRMDLIEGALPLPKLRSRHVNLFSKCISSSAFRYIFISLIFVQLIFHVFILFALFQKENLF